MEAFGFGLKASQCLLGEFHENLVVIDTERKWTIKANAEEYSVKILKPIVVCSKGLFLYYVKPIWQSVLPVSSKRAVYEGNRMSGVIISS